jgi:hypothetical protein
MITLPKQVGSLYDSLPTDKVEAIANRDKILFLSGTEDQDYADDSKNWMYYSVNTIANYDKAIIPYLDSPIGTNLERLKGTDDFIIVVSK